MGYWEHKQDEMTENGMNLWNADGKYLCSACIGDDTLKAFIRENAEETQCDYCCATSDKPIAANLATFVRHLTICIEKEWGDANGLLPRDDKTGEPIPICPTMSTRNLVSYQLELSLPNDEDCDLLDDIVEALPDRTWCRGDPLVSPEHESIMASWEIFCDVIKHERRFFFLQYKNDKLEDWIRTQEAIFQVAEFLREVSAYCGRAGMFVSIAAGASYVRCRPKERGNDRQFGPRCMGPPPKDDATQANRMSPAGIPMFYGAESAEVALAETTITPGRFAVGTFQVQRDLMLLDLRRAPQIPSLFDPVSARDRPWALFMSGFIADFQKPIERNGRDEHVEYVPTQVVTEYFRTIAQFVGAAIDGILYASTRRPGETAVVLFADTFAVETGQESPVTALDNLRAKIERERHDAPWLKMTSYREFEFDPNVGTIPPVLGGS